MFLYRRFFLFICVFVLYVVSVYLCFCTIECFCLSVLLYHMLFLFTCVFVLYVESVYLCFVPYVVSVYLCFCTIC